jgi:hypothetical protein
MKTHHWIIMASFALASITGCAAAEPTPGDDEATEQAEQIAETEQAAGTQECEFTYYSGPDHAVEVGWCGSVCGHGFQCVGRKTIYKVGGCSPCIP